MARRKAKSRRKSPRTVSLWNMGVGYVNLSMFTQAALGTSPTGFLFGAADIKLATDNWMGR
jgi:hypothetical protein